MYKDKDRQRQANRKAQARFKAKAKGITEQGITNEGITDWTEISDADFIRLLAKAGHKVYRVSKPGDADYVPMCETTRRFCQGRGAGSEST